MELLKHEDILSFDEIVNVVEVAAQLGIEKIRLTEANHLSERILWNLSQ